jgi:hypothetical protein
MGLSADEARRAALLEHVHAIAGAPKEARVEAVAARLDAVAAGGGGWTRRLEAFEGGRNLVVELPALGGERGAARLLILGAHLDRVEKGEGAVDNAASCAILLELLRTLRAEAPPGGLLVVFFDAEEKGLVGSRAWVERHGERLRGPRPSAYLNLDVNAYGDQIYFGRHPEGPSWIAGVLELALRRLQRPGIGSSAYPPSDHLSLRSERIDAVSMSILPEEEARGVIGLFSGRPPSEPPRVLRLIHTAEDRRERVEAAALELGLEVAIEVVRLSGRRLEVY